MSKKRGSPEVQAQPQFIEPLRFKAPRRRYRPLTMNVFYLAANNIKPAEIARMLKMPEKRVSYILNAKRARTEISQIAFKMTGEDMTKAFTNLVPETIQTQAEIMRDRSIKPSTRLMASRDIQDRALGKPKIEVEVNNTSSVRKLLQEIHAQKAAAEGAPIEVNGRELAPEEAQIIMAQARESVPARTQDETDAWIAEFL